MVEGNTLNRESLPGFLPVFPYSHVVLHIELTTSTLPAFAIGLKDGVTSLEFDCGLTKDGAVIVWHDEIIDATKCRDTNPAFEGDESYPYVGKNVANLTLAQIKTLDCGSLRIDGFPFSGTSEYISAPSFSAFQPFGLSMKEEQAQIQQPSILFSSRSVLGMVIEDKGLTSRGSTRNETLNIG